MRLRSLPSASPPPSFTPPPVTAPPPWPSRFSARRAGAPRSISNTGLAPRCGSPPRPARPSPPDPRGAARGPVPAPAAVPALPCLTLPSLPACGTRVMGSPRARACRLLPAGRRVPPRVRRGGNSRAGAARPAGMGLLPWPGGGSPSSQPRGSPEATSRCNPGRSLRGEYLGREKSNFRCLVSLWGLLSSTRVGLM